MTVGAKQTYLVAGVIMLSAFLYLAPQKLKNPPADQNLVKQDEFQSILAEAKSQMKRQELEPITKLESVLKSNPENIALLESLGKLWDNAKFPAVSAHYFEVVAEKQPSEKTWNNAAYRYFDSFKMAGDSNFRSMMVEKAIAGYKKVLEFNPGNLDAKTDLGICYVEGTSTPMQGIMMLRDVVKENPQHENAQYNLGVLSVRSGQFDKAIDRFVTVLTINPERVEARILLGRCYIETGNLDKALETLEIAKKQTSDPQLIQEVSSLISQINNHKTL